MGRGKRNISRELPLSDSGRQRRLPTLVIDRPLPKAGRSDYLTEVLCAMLRKPGSDFQETLSAALQAVAVPREQEFELRQALLELLDGAATDAYSDNATDLDAEDLGYLIKDLLWTKMEDGVGYTVSCSICDQLCAAVLAHDVEGKVIGDSCCWDERLRSVQ